MVANMEAVLSSFPGKYTQLAEQVFRGTMLILSLNREDIEDTKNKISVLTIQVFTFGTAFRLWMWPENLIIEVVVNFLQQLCEMFDLLCLKRVLDILEYFSQLMLDGDSKRMHLVPILLALSTSFAIYFWCPSWSELGTFPGYGFEWLVSQVNSHMLWRYLLCETNDGWPSGLSLFFHVVSFICIEAGTWNPWPFLHEWCDFIRNNNTNNSAGVSFCFLNMTSSASGSCTDLFPSGAPPVDGWFLCGVAGITLFYLTKPDPHDQTKRDDRIHSKNTDSGYLMLKAALPGVLPTGDASEGASTSASTSASATPSAEEVEFAAMCNETLKNLCGSVVVGVTKTAFPSVATMCSAASGVREGARMLDTLIAGSLVRNNIGDHGASLADTRLMKLLLVFRHVNLDHVNLVLTFFSVCFYCYLGYAKEITDSYFNSGEYGKNAFHVCACVLGLLLLGDIYLRLFSNDTAKRSWKGKSQAIAAPEQRMVEDEAGFLDARETWQVKGYHLRLGFLACSPDAGPTGLHRAILEEKTSRSSSLREEAGTSSLEILRFDPVADSVPKSMVRTALTGFLGQEPKTWKSDFVAIKINMSDRNYYMTMLQDGSAVFEEWNKEAASTREAGLIESLMGWTSSVFDFASGETLPDSTPPRKFHWMREERRGHAETSVQYRSVATNEILELTAQRGDFKESMWLEQRL